MIAAYYADEHVTLYHGDCLELADLWTGADVLVTDPPYGVGGALTWVANMRHEWDELHVRDAALAAWGDRPAVTFGSPRRLDAMPEHRQHPLIWDKGDMLASGDTTFPWRLTYEMIYVSGDGWAGHRGPGVLRFPHTTSAASAMGHPTPKPVGLMYALMQKAPPGMIADPFAGSGSTLVAARMLGRQAVGVEINEAYCEVAARRLSQGDLFAGW